MEREFSKQTLTELTTQEVATDNLISDVVSPGFSVTFFRLYSYLLHSFSHSSFYEMQKKKPRKMVSSWVNTIKLLKIKVGEREIKREKSRERSKGREIRRERYQGEWEIREWKREINKCWSEYFLSNLSTKHLTKDACNFNSRNQTFIPFPGLWNFWV